MTMKEMLKQVLIVGNESGTMGRKESLFALGIAFLIALYIFVIYRMFVRKTLYNINMNISLVGLTIIVSAIMITIQTNLILSLGMVGALSIVRYRTAVKDPVDLLFLFWAIATGIMTGAGQFVLAILVAVLMSVVVLVLSQLPTMKTPYVLVVNGASDKLEDELESVLPQYCKNYKVKARNISAENERMIIELKVKAEKDLLAEISALAAVQKVSLLTYEGDMIC